ncbi:hypothetical protein pb186bvf_015209 [Paramecium bursaria]
MKINVEPAKFNVQLKVEADEFKRQFKFVEKEKLFMELQAFKIEANTVKEENMKLKTRLQQQDKELQRYERLCEEMQNYIAGQKNGKQVHPDSFIIQLRKQNKDLTNELKEKTSQLEQLKKHSKVTKYQELEYDRKSYYEETLRMRKLLDDTAQQHQQMLQKFNQTLLLENEVSKVLKINEGLVSENKQYQSQVQQNEDLIKQLQQLYKVNQLKCQTLEKQITELKSNIKKIQAEKTNLKLTIKQMQDSQYAAINKTVQQTPPKPKRVPQPQVSQLLVEELRYKLSLRQISYQQFVEMLNGLKQQAKQQNVQVRLDDLENILKQEPFHFVDQRKISQIINSLHGKGNALIDSFQQAIGNFKSFSDYPTFDFQQCDNMVRKQLLTNAVKIREYWKIHHQSDKITKNDMKKFLQAFQFKWDDPTQLFYFTYLFEKCGEDFTNIKVDHIINPFPDEDPNHQHMRISEESEELFDKQSQDYSLDEKAIINRNQQGDEKAESENGEQHIVFRNEGQIQDIPDGAHPEKEEEEYEQNYDDDKYENQEEQENHEEQDQEHLEHQDEQEFENDHEQEQEQEDNKDEQEYEQNFE